MFFLCLTGSIMVKAPLDYESENSYEIVVVAWDPVNGTSSNVLVAIDVIDVNDNHPDWSSSVYQVSVPESAPVGISLLSVHATDRDEDGKQRVYYSFNDDQVSKLFKIDSTSGHIYLNSEFDYETSSEHLLLVKATDAGQPSMSSTAEVRISVLDRNDNAPRFTERVFNSSIHSLVTPNRFVAALTAYDLDSVASTPDGMRFTVSGPSTLEGLLVVSSDGIVRIRGDQPAMHLVTSDQNNVIVFNITVSDGVYVDTAELHVTVVPINTQAPKFSQSHYTTSIRENSSPMMLHVPISANDPDSGIFGDVKFSIDDENLSQLFAIHPKTGFFSTLEPLDYETAPNGYLVPIVASDGGDLSTTTTVSVRIIDEPDTPPKFLSKHIRQTVLTTTEVGKAVVHFPAVTKSTIVTYVIRPLGNDNDSEMDPRRFFRLNTRTGLISAGDTLATLNKNEITMLSFNLTASIDASLSLMDWCRVDVMVTSKVPAEIASLNRSVEILIYENATIGSFIGNLNKMLRLSASSNVQFTLLVDEEGYFNVHRNGTVQLVRPINYETSKKHQLPIEASVTIKSQGQSVIYPSLFVLTVNVGDVNDSIPQFRLNGYQFSVLESVSIGSPIGSVAAFDEDTSSEIIYQVDNATNLPFDVSSEGDIVVTRKLNFDKVETYEFTVNAIDNSRYQQYADGEGSENLTLPMMSSVNVKIIVVDEDDEAPKFSQPLPDKLVVQEQAPSSSVVFMFKATDPDSDHINFHLISSGADRRRHFALRNDGRLVLARSDIDREQSPRFDLTLGVSDGNHLTTMKVPVEVLDQDDTPPVCLKLLYILSIPEDLPTGRHLTQLEVSDRDETHALTYRVLQQDALSAGVVAFPFTITGSGPAGSAQLVLDKSLDREETDKYEFTIEVTDQSGAACRMEFIIFITDINDNAPKFCNPATTRKCNEFLVSENSPVKIPVGKVDSFDADLGMNAKISYEFGNDVPSDLFSIHSGTGVILLEKSLDRETQEFYNLTVIAHDSGSPSLSTTTVVRIRVEDANDNAPDFEKHIYTTEVAENASIGSTLMTVKALNKDAGQNAITDYSIADTQLGSAIDLAKPGQERLFEVDQESGDIRLLKALDFERNQVHQFIILAIDRGIPPLSGTAQVEIHVLDINDNKPVFQIRNFSAVVSEDSQVGDHVLTLLAKDADSGENGKITYSILKQTTEFAAPLPFAIEPETGKITVSGLLDYEMYPNGYTFTVQATDGGKPPNGPYSDQAMVSVGLTDVNDNPPRFNRKSFNLTVQENHPLHVPIVRFTVTDVDSLPNQGPFSFDMVPHKGTNGHLFVLQTVNTEAGSCQLLFDPSARVKVGDRFGLTLSARDNGGLATDVEVSVLVVEQSRTPPKFASEEAELTVRVDLTRVKNDDSAVLAVIHATDADPYDMLNFALIPPFKGPFKLRDIEGTNSALLEANGRTLQPGRYTFNISASDGSFTSFTKLKLTIEAMSSDALSHGGVVITVDSIDMNLFVRETFILEETIEKLGICDKVQVVAATEWNIRRRNRPRSVVGVHRGVSALLLGQFHNGTYMESYKLAQKISDKLETIRRRSKLIVSSASTGADCSDFKPPCENNGQCVALHALVYHQNRSPYESATTPIFNDDFLAQAALPSFSSSPICRCNQGYVGQSCDRVVDTCQTDESCPDHMLCLPVRGDPKMRCICPPTEPKCLPVLARATTIDDLHMPLPGEIEQLTSQSIAFVGWSHLTIETAKPSADLTTLWAHQFEFRTRVQYGLVLQAQIDEISNILLMILPDSGHLVLRIVQNGFDIRSPAPVALQRVSDGNWHSVKFRLWTNAVEVALDNNNALVENFPNGITLQSIRSVSIGGLSENNTSGIAVHQINGFVGCMRGLPMQEVKFRQNIIDVCPSDLFAMWLPAEPCSSVSPSCSNGGLCVPHLTPSPVAALRFAPPTSSLSCVCRSDRFRGLSCEQDASPCDDQPCLHGGACRNDPSNVLGFTCSCPQPFYGNRCELGLCRVNINKTKVELGAFSAERPICNNGGSCADAYPTPVCSCPSGFTGE